MKMKEKWSQFSIGTKVTVSISLIVVLVLVTLGVVVIQTRKSMQIESNSDRMIAHVNDLYSMLELNHRAKSESVSIALAYANVLFNAAGELSQDTSQISVQVTNQETGESRSVEIFPLMINNSSLWNSSQIVDRIQEEVAVTSTIFQRIEGGFLRISTNVRTRQGQRATETYIPDSSPVAISLLYGDVYKGRAAILNEYFITAYQPLYVGGQIAGAIFVGVPEKDLGFLATTYADIKYFDSGYPFLVDSEGNIIVHPTEQGNNIVGSEVFQHMITAGEGTLMYCWPEDQRNAPERRLFFRFFEPYQTFVAATVTEYEFVDQATNNARILVLVAIVFGIIFLVLALRFIMKQITTPINQTSEILEGLAKGKQLDHFITTRKDEIGGISQSLNKLIDGLKATAEFANEIEKRNFNHQFTPLSDEDVLGNALIDMRKSLQKAEIEDQKRKEEDKKRNWATEGLARFSDILRQNTDKIDVLSFNIIKNLVKYLEVNQGGIFVINNELDNEPFLELTACYAFDRQKFLDKKVEIGEGLTGTCFLEKQTIYLKQIPQDYISITSGLGEANPDSLLLVPLKLNKEVYGVIELASFEPFEPHEIEFVEKIAESIASTLSSVKINMRTALLLEQSQQQAEEMKAQEEEMRQNMEELEATQEEIARKSEEQKIKDEQMQAQLKEKVEEMQSQEEELRQTMEAMTQSQREMEKVKEELGALVDNMPGIVYQCLLDENFTMDFMSDYCEKITGFKADDFLGNKKLAYADLIHPDDLDHVNKIIEEAIEKKSAFFMEYRLKDKNGKYHKVGEHGSAMVDKQGKVHHLQGLVFELK